MVCSGGGYSVVWISIYLFICLVAYWLLSFKNIWWLFAVRLVNRSCYFAANIWVIICKYVRITFFSFSRMDEDSVSTLLPFVISPSLYTVFCLFGHSSAALVMVTRAFWLFLRMPRPRKTPGVWLRKQLRELKPTGSITS